MCQMEDLVSLALVILVVKLASKGYTEVSKQSATTTRLPTALFCLPSSSISLVPYYNELSLL